jgi:lysophospholipid acyltransferase (LPLAT)-like uncharacterized protein
MKPLLTNIKISLISFFGWILLRIIYFTTRSLVIVAPRSETYMLCRNEPIVITFWHGYQIMMLRILEELFGPHPKRKTFVLISEHNDGRMIAGAMKYFSLDTIAGSSTRGAKKATVKMIRTLEGGDNVAITPDGPKGPLHEVKNGVLKIAQISGRPIIPMAVDASRAWTLKSWDKMKIPKPFSLISFAFGDPFYVPKDLSDDELEQKAKELKKLIDQQCSIASGVIRD